MPQLKPKSKKSKKKSKKTRNGKNKNWYKKLEGPSQFYSEKVFNTNSSSESDSDFEIDWGEERNEVSYELTLKSPTDDSVIVCSVPAKPTGKKYMKELIHCKNCGGCSLELGWEIQTEEGKFYVIDYHLIFTMEELLAIILTERIQKYARTRNVKKKASKSN
ncbi:hypothetical protein LOD99_14741 [Oopsacas minuta]|uniref:Uncharacterized protein n=1 Tax=Oopsacas minuta TaxID=111878 RepID=A0AAV7KEB9_9METZ|nr:hypothetical protein LOD99_14741 [Oopsacas minuta]